MRIHKSKIAALLVGVMLTGQPGLSASPVFSAGSAADGIIATADGQQAIPPVTEGWVELSAPEHLVYIDQHQEQYVDKNLRLLQDIDLSGVPWIPFGGNEYAPFSGVFDGQGHFVKGVTIDGYTREYAGFFGEASGSIRNLSLELNIKGGSITGGVAGILSGGSIERAYTKGSVTSILPRTLNLVTAAGGITGILERATIERSSSDAAVTVGPGANRYGGGISGFPLYSSITDSYSGGPVRNTEYTGISFLFTAGVSAYVIGSEDRNTIKHTYSRGIIPSDYPAATYTGRAGIASYMTRTDVYSSYFDTNTTGMTVGIYSSYGSDILEATAKTTAEMKQQTTYRGWDFGHIWNMNSKVNDGYPYFRPEVLTEALPYAVHNKPYSYALAGYDGAHAGLTWSASGLPAGLSLSASGEIQGTPTAAVPDNRSYTVKLTAIDAGGAAAVRSLQLEVKRPAPELNVALQPGTAIGTTAIEVVPQEAGSSFAYLLDRAENAPPLLDSSLPEGAAPYIPGSDLSGVQPGTAVDLYEINGQGHIRAWQRVVLEAAHIRQEVPVSCITLEPSSLLLTAGGAPVKLTPILKPDTATYKEVTWMSTDPAVAEVDELSGEIRPLSPGQAVIVATASNGLTAEASLTVESAAGSVTGSVYSSELDPNAGATVSLGGITGLTDLQGHFRLDHITVGTHLLTIEAADYHTFTQSIEIVEGQTADTGRITLTSSKTPEPEPSPTPTPTATPTATPSPTPTATPTPTPTATPTVTPSPSPIATPSPSPTATPSPSPDIAIAPVGPAATVDPAKVLLSINGQGVMVTVSREITTGGQSVIRLKPDAAILAQALAAQNEVRIEFQTDRYSAVFLDLPAEALLNRLKLASAASTPANNSGTSAAAAEGFGTGPDAPAITLAVNGAVHQLPLRGFDGFMPALDSGSIVTLGISWPTAAEREVLSAVLANQGAELTGSPVAFSMERNGKPVESLSDRQTSIYLNKTLPLPSPADPLPAAVVRVDQNNRVHFAPALFSATTGEAIIHSPQNGLFAAIAPRRSFTDTAGHWAEEDIQLLANKWIIQGVSGASFSPDTVLTRAELTALLVRSLGWMESGAARSFVDVPSGTWYAAAVTTAQEAGLMTGYEDGTFRPNAGLTHEQLAAVIARALSLAGKAPQINGITPEALDGTSALAPWAVQPASMLLEAGLLKHSEAAGFSPKAPVTRAEGAVMLTRMLQYLKFIDS